MKEYRKIPRFELVKDLFNPNDIVAVEEKIDGANASFGIIDGRVQCFSRKNKLHEGNRLRGFYDWVMTTIKPEYLVEGYIYFGEWLVPHTIKYHQDSYKKFYLFDVYDVKNEKWLPYTVVYQTAEVMGWDMVPFIERSRFDVLDFDGLLASKSKLTDNKIEGVVLKNLTNGTYAKIVNQEFKELQKPKKKHRDQNQHPIDAAIKETITEARIRKLLHKKVDSAIIDSKDLVIENHSKVLPLIMKDIIDDIITEEFDQIKEVLLKHTKRTIGKVVPKILADVLKGKDDER